jgi:hypothetical protein
MAVSQPVFHSNLNATRGLNSSPPARRPVTLLTGLQLFKPFGPTADSHKI